MTRKTITVSEETFERLDELRGDVRWDVFLRELAEGATNADAFEGEPLTVDHIDDVAARAADKVEDRLRRR